ncbi:MAG TPA: hypothetical protein VMC79_04210 [Rectinemataceae bacterium]|nr:hypothetical protein [Rectinemataceae bacterium]
MFIRPHPHVKGIESGQECAGRALTFDPQAIFADEISLGLAPIVVDRLPG